MGSQFTEATGVEVNVSPGDERAPRRAAKRAAAREYFQNTPAEITDFTILEVNSGLEFVHSPIVVEDEVEYSPLVEEFVDEAVDFTDLTGSPRDIRAARRARVARGVGNDGQRNGKKRLILEDDEILEAPEIDILPEETLDPMPDTEGEVPDFEELPVEEEYRSGNSSYDEEARYDPKYADFVKQSDNVYDDNDGEEEVLAEVPLDDVCIGQKWPTVKHARVWLKNYGIRSNFEIVWEHNDPLRLRGKCKASPCPWKIHISKLPGSLNFKVKKLTAEHTCSKDTDLTNRMADAPWVAATLEKDMMNEPCGCK